jgi:hypothetical protein
MAKTKSSQPEDTTSILLPLDPSMPTDELLRNLRMNALLVHQVSVGRGDELVQILKRTIEQMERTYGRIQRMSIILFGTGLILLAVGILEIIFGGRGQEIWAAIMGGVGGVATIAATFWTTPLDRMSASISDLVKLEVAFLGYIRVIGELDSSFQMQYLNILAKPKGLGLDQIINDTTGQMKDIMQHTLMLIDKYVVGQGYALSELEKSAEEMNNRLKNLESKLTPTT